MDGAILAPVRSAFNDSQDHAGSIFLDEIHLTTTRLQIELLHVLQDHFQRFCETQGTLIDARFIAASSRYLLDEVNAGRFCEELFYRLSVVTILLPPCESDAKTSRVWSGTSCDL